MLCKFTKLKDFFLKVKGSGSKISVEYYSIFKIVTFREHGFLYSKITILFPLL